MHKRNKKLRLKCSLRDKLKNENFPHNRTKFDLNFQENLKFWRGNHFLTKNFEKKEFINKL